MAHIPRSPLEGTITITSDTIPILSPKSDYSYAPAPEKDTSWMCPYCHRSNETSQRYCGEDTTHGCGAARKIKEKLPQLAGVLLPNQELIYKNDHRLPTLLMDANFSAVLEI